jgi:UDP-N-acetylmuramyl tripeptide synthase
MQLIESRRITGRHLLTDEPGAAAELLFEAGEDGNDALDLIGDRALGLAEALGWPRPRFTVRRGSKGASVALTAPVDQLMTATSLLDWAARGSPSEAEVRAEAAREENLALRSSVAAAHAAGLPVFWDDEGLTFGLGCHSETLPLTALPAVPDPARHKPIRFAFITGTNGKTTTSRLLSHMASVSGLRAGHTSSDGVQVAGAWVDRGDWTGPGAARTLLRRPDVELAVLETARGGLLRRGLAVDGAAVAVVTNISDDHLGEWGIDDQDAMADAKLVVARGLRQGGTLVVDADCPPLRAAVARVWRDRPDLVVRWFSMTEPTEGAVIDGHFILGGQRLMRVVDAPITVEGAARYNIANALAAALAAQSLGISLPAIREALTTFLPSPDQSRGRTNLFRVGGATVLVDFAHNPDGLRRIAELARNIPAARRLLLIGQSGDRSAAHTQAMAEQAASIPPDLVVIKELPAHLRGRSLGEVPAELRRELLAAGVADKDILIVNDEVEAVRALLGWARDEDLLILLVHEQFDGVMGALQQAGAHLWTPRRKVLEAGL